jgi:hypothetical protein
MNKNFNLIAKELFGKIRTQFPKIQLGDQDSKVTSKTEDARFFDFDYMYEGTSLGRITVNLSDEDGLVVMYSNDIVEGQSEFVKNNFFDFIKELREFAKQRFLNFDTRDITKSNLDRRDFNFLSQNTGEGNMTESKLFGTSKTSYQQLGDSKIILKHSAPVNQANPAGRTQRIESIYIENAQGERFRYPFKHLNGARALAQHIGHGGNPYDSIGQHVIGLSEELAQLRKFKGYVERNDTISENMGSIHSKVLERIDSVKKEIYNLQHPSRYELFAESFKESLAKEIPEDVMNDWVDRLTIRSFNEELKTVFPYIFRLVDESDIPVKELSIEDLVTEDDLADTDTGYREVKEFAQYENFLDQIIERTDIFSDKEDSQGAAVDKLNQLIAEPFPVGPDGTNAIESLSGIIEDDELMDIFKELADVSPDSDVRDILKDYIQMKDEEEGTDVLSKINFTEEEPGMDGAPEAPEEPAAEPAPAPAEPAAEVPPAEPAPAAPPQPVTADIWGESFTNAVNKAKKAGATAETVIRIAGQDMSLGEAITKAGMKVEDVFGNKSDELIEFVKSMYNREEGNFPKGETGVLIACEKKFGESSLSIAKKVIGKLHQISEMTRMKKLAGLSQQ